jgi:hypothetical protein
MAERQKKWIEMEQKLVAAATAVSNAEAARAAAEASLQNLQTENVRLHCIRLIRCYTLPFTNSLNYWANSLPHAIENI